MRHEAIDRYAPLFRPPDRSFDGFLRRRDRKRRNRKIGALALVLAITILALGGVLLSFKQTGIPANPTITQQNLGDLGVAWTASVAGQPSGLYNAFGVSAQEPFPPTLAGDMVYVGTFDGNVYAFPATCGSDGTSCQPAWVADAGAGVPFPPTVADGLVYVGTTAGRLIAYPVGCATDGSSCSPSWVGDTGHTIASSPVIADGLVFGIDSQGGTLYAFPADCGTGGAACSAVWTSSVHTGPVPRGQAIVRHGNQIGQVFAPAVADGVVYAPSFGRGEPDRLFALDEQTGRQLWVARAQELGTSPFWNVPVVASGLVFEVFQTRLYAFPARCTPVGGICEPAWSVDTHQLEGDVVMGRAVISGDSVYVKTWRSETLGHTFAFRVGPCATPCRPSWSMQDDGFGDVLVSDGVVYSPSIHGGYVDTAPINCERGGRPCPQVGRLEAFEGPVLPTAGDGVAFWGTEQGAVYGVPSSCVGAGSCPDTWKWIGGSQPLSSPAVDASMLFVAARDGTVTAFAVGSAGHPGPRGTARARTALFYGAIVLVIGAWYALRVRRRHRI